MTDLPEIAPDRPVLIAGPTASGKSALALDIARRGGGVIVNADASQVYDCWRVITARPSEAEEAEVPHALYGHVACSASYSAGHWLRDVTPLLRGPARPIIVGGTGLYFSALTQGMADIPETPPAIRAEANTLPLATLLAGIDAGTRSGIDIRNRARVQRAFEVQAATGRSLADWQADTPAPALALRDVCALMVDAPRDWLLDRINRRFDKMLAMGALDEVRAMLDRYDPSLPAFRAIGVPELAAHLRGEMTLDAAREAATVSTRQFAKRQRTWFRARMGGWTRIDAAR
ncbi:tRNA (adenosine(37)-N6)-dimethylallyltransferase MiaA [Sedimentitalea sp. JM2-8]|uniref:tRNA dimethylallyltransferase n=1 Tax=Sedimentitalea xiamensis TaxID=3050037 RepID=A0ABT7FBP7_9RHOB|nr:tRNA (adenosine(37)-N6)-dimethylallyltransferase MiaA [Sedimentitalea xiamensis]MDK3072533.1 tRNA (adenosine(37)-N6)-dimethylallyltransferase MiaA [Sedimentitalea xiamensis]